MPLIVATKELRDMSLLVLQTDEEEAERSSEHC